MKMWHVLEWITDTGDKHTDTPSEKVSRKTADSKTPTTQEVPFFKEAWSGPGGHASAHDAWERAGEKNRTDNSKIQLDCMHERHGRPPKGKYSTDFLAAALCNKFGSLSPSPVTRASVTRFLLCPEATGKASQYGKPDTRVGV